MSYIVVCCENKKGFCRGRFYKVTSGEMMLNPSTIVNDYGEELIYDEVVKNGAKFVLVNETDIK